MLLVEQHQQMVSVSENKRLVPKNRGIMVHLVPLDSLAGTSSLASLAFKLTRQAFRALVRHSHPRGQDHTDDDVEPDGGHLLMRDGSTVAWASLKMDAKDVDACAQSALRNESDPCFIRLLTNVSDLNREKKKKKTKKTTTIKVETVVEEAEKVVATSQLLATVSNPIAVVVDKKKKMKSSTSNGVGRDVAQTSTSRPTARGIATRSASSLSRLH
jgi:hypothetical protein